MTHETRPFLKLPEQITLHLRFQGVSNRLHSAGRLGEGFLRRPFRTTLDHTWDRIHGFNLRSAAQPHSKRALLVKASLELDEPLSWHPALRVSSGVDLSTGSEVVSPHPLDRLGPGHRPVGAGFTGPTAPNINNANHVFHAGF
jgi:hypothetical protein